MENRMQPYCHDRDLLAIEPILFVGSGLACQQLLAASSAVVNGTTLTAAGVDFSAAGIAAGMVLTAWHTAPAEGLAVEIVSVDAPDSLTVSVLRPLADDPAVAPPIGASPNWFIRSYGPQIASVSQRLGERLREMCEAAGLASANFAPSSQLRTAAAIATLAEVFTARAQGPADTDANWIKARHYRQEYHRLVAHLRLATDADGNGLAERTRSLSNVTLRRS
jgi:hypothetical protein